MILKKVCCEVNWKNH